MPGGGCAICHPDGDLRKGGAAWPSAFADDADADEALAGSLGGLASELKQLHTQNVSAH